MISLAGAIACGGGGDSIRSVAPQGAQTFALAVTLAGSGQGAVRSTDGLIDCAANCAASYAAGAQVTLTATAAAGSSFTGWSGVCAGAASCVVAMMQAQTAVAQFDLAGPPALHTLTVALTGSGTVTSAPGGIDCGPTCASQFADGSSIALSAAPGAGFVFGGWSGACTGTGACAVTLTADTTVSASFSPAGSPPATYVVSVTVSGAGSVASAPTGIDCGPAASSCAASFASGTTVQLTATPADGATFADWSGACSGAAACSITSSVAVQVSAAFTSASAPPPPTSAPGSCLRPAPTISSTPRA